MTVLRMIAGAALCVASTAAFGLLTGCSGPQVGYIATDGDIAVGTGAAYGQGAYAGAKCDFTTGSVRIYGSKLPEGFPVTLNSKAAVCDTAAKKLIVPVRTAK